MVYHNSEKSVLCVLMVLITVFHRFSCECVQSYMLICDTIEDFRKENDGSWVNVMIKPSKPGPSWVELNTNDFQDVANSVIIVGQINNINVGSCSYRLDLPAFSLFDNELKKLHANISSVIRPQKLLGLVKNKIEVIEPYAFAGLDTQLIDLSNNLLEVILSNTFTTEESTNSIETIIIRNNKLTLIEARSFPPNLNILKLDNNELGFFQDEVIDYLVNLQGLFISRNKFYTIPDIQNLASLKVLDISHNNVYKIERTTFENLEYLEILDLSYNKIKQVDFLEPLLIRNRFFVASLAFNLLHDLRFNIDKNVSLDSSSLILFGNPWWCHRWISIQKYLNETGLKQTECDLAHFNRGQFPFCFSFQGEPLAFPSTPGNERYISLSPPMQITDNELKIFLGAIENTETLMDCKLTVPRILLTRYIRAWSCKGPALIHVLLK